jgi:hypothetical protein
MSDLSGNRHIVHSRLNRRRLIGGLAGGAFTTIAVGGLVAAQGTSAKPAGTPASDSSSRNESGSTENAGQGAAGAIASVKKDRDAVASKIDVTTVDRILAVATTLQSQSSSATTSSATSREQLASAAETTAWSARDVIEAELSAYGLPSQQIGVSQVLADLHGSIVVAGKTVASAKNPGATSLLTISQQLYTSAYDQYGAGTFAQFEKTGDAAAGLTDAIDELLGTSDSGTTGGNDNQGDGEQNDGGNGSTARTGTPAGNAEGGSSDSEQNGQGGDRQSDNGSDGSDGGGGGENQGQNGADSPDPTTPVDVPAPSF